MTSGVPDLLIIDKGLHVFIELKTDEGKTSPIQDHTFRIIQKSGGIVRVCRSVDEVRQIIKKGGKNAHDT